MKTTLCILVLFSLIHASVWSQTTDKQKALKTGSSAPDFLINDIRGNTYKLSDLQGKIVVLNFWFTQCAPCIEELPELNALIEKYKDEPTVVFLSITYDPKYKVEKFLIKHPFRYPVAAGQKALDDQYGIAGYPTNMVPVSYTHLTLPTILRV